MPEAIYQIDFAGRVGDGRGVIFLSDGRVIGTDTGVDYDGTYGVGGNGKTVHAKVRCTVRPGTMLVMGVDPVDYTWSFDLGVDLPDLGEGTVPVQTPFGPIMLKFELLRRLN